MSQHKFERDAPSNLSKMATCISRRAYADRETIRLIDEDGKPGRHIWLEYRCPNKVSKEDEVCADCSYKLPKYKYQANQKCNHGIVGGPYPADSKLYGSPFYEKQIKSGWKILDIDEIRAKAEVDKASRGMGRKKTVPAAVDTAEPKSVAAVAAPEPKPEPEPMAAPIAALVPVKQKRAYKKKTPEEKIAKAVKAAKSGKPAALKLDVIMPTPPPVTETPCDPKFIEVVAPPIMITDFVTVKVKKMKCQGKDYYHDAASGKLYGISVNGVGAYKGRYNAEEDAVVNFPDSDEE